MSDRDSLIRLLAERSVKTGNFVLASGKTSSVYVDARLTTMSPDGLSLIGPLGLDTMIRAGWKAESVGGLTLGADPIAYSISYASARLERPIRAFTVRKQVKSHGAANLIEGPFRPTDSVVIVEDVITTGGSALRAIDAVEQAGGTVMGVLALVDREEGGRETIEARGLDVITLSRITEILALQ
ncbi:MAG: orotate phosphoribosyltransferase [Gemmatimonadaceae bacterium]